MEICTECPRESKHKYPYPLCDKHYVDKFSYQVINGVKMPFKEWLQGELEKQGLWFNEGETRREWFARMEEHGRSALLKISKGKKAKIGAYKIYARNGSDCTACC